MKILGLDHIGIAVESIEKAMEFYHKALGLTLDGVEEIADRHLKIGFINTKNDSSADNTRIELIEPTSTGTTISNFIKKRGEGIHHLCFLVDDIEEALERMRAEGFRLIDNRPQIGASGSRIAFLHPKTAGGVLIELKEIKGD